MLIQGQKLNQACANKALSDGVVDRASAAEAVDAGSIPVSGQVEDFRKLVFTASLLRVQQ